MNIFAPFAFLGTLAWKAALIVLVAWLVARLARLPAAGRHLVWTLAIAGLFLLPALHVLLPAWELPFLPSSPAPAGTAPVSIGMGTAPVDASEPVAGDSTVLQARSSAGSEAPARGRPAAAAWSWHELAALVFAVGVVLTLVHLFVALARVHALCRAADDHVGYDAAWRELLASVTSSSGLRRPIRLLMSHRLEVPLTWGWWRPVILLPAAGQEWSTEYRRQILVHEVAHVRRADWLTLLLARVTCAVFWFHPLVWLAARQLFLEAERACDDEVLRGGYRPVDYAETLLALARRLQGPRLATIGMARPSELSRRILTILDPGSRRTAVKRPHALSVSVLIVVLVVSLASSRFVQSEEIVPSGAAPVLSEAPQSEALSEEALMQAIHLALEGGKLSEDEAGGLEEHLQQDPDDLDARTRLLGFYAGDFSKSGRQAQASHGLWFIRHHPDAAIVTSGYMSIDNTMTPAAHAEARSLWLEHTETYANNVRILGNAAQFFLLPERDLAERFLLAAQALEPANPHWPERLGQLHALGLPYLPSAAQREAATKSLSYLETALAATGADQRFPMLTNVAKMAFESGELEKARFYAQEMLDTANQYTSDWNYGNAVHHGNLILGRVALEDDDVESAKSYLIAAGKTPGSPQLNSFGPNMALARDLLERDESDVVLEYFELCAKFWERPELDQWTALVEKGLKPDFRANLH